MHNGLIFPCRLRRLNPPCVFPRLVPRLDVGVPKGRGHFDPEASGGRAEKSGWGTTQSPVLKLTQVGKESILRRSRELRLRN
jgi:hypothetical protein